MLRRPSSPGPSEHSQSLWLRIPTVCPLETRTPFARRLLPRRNSVAATARSFNARQRARPPVVPCATQNRFTLRSTAAGKRRSPTARISWALNESRLGSVQEDHPLLPVRTSSATSAANRTVNRDSSSIRIINSKYHWIYSLLVLRVLRRGRPCLGWGCSHGEASA